MPVMEIVFVLQKTEVEQDKRVSFESVWGLPMIGMVEFEESEPSEPGRQVSTTVTLRLQHTLPELLVEMGVGPFGMLNSLRPILADNMDAFKALAEAVAAAGTQAEAAAAGAVPPRQEAGAREYTVFDEDAHELEAALIIDRLDFLDEPDEDEGAAAEQAGLGRGAAQAASRPQQRPQAQAPAQASVEARPQPEETATASTGAAAGGANDTPAAGRRRKAAPASGRGGGGGSGASRGGAAVAGAPAGAGGGAAAASKKRPARSRGDA